MDKVARLTAQQRSELFSESAAQKGTTPAVVEKDFWVTWVLHCLFRQPTLARILRFKGGTSLSKVYHLIERFSEDIDLIIDWRVLSGEDPLAERSRSKQGKLNAQLNEQAQHYIGGEMLSLIVQALDGICQCSIDASDPHVININHPASFVLKTFCFHKN